eukprot:Selendium_serpulae@DN3774_c0_g1_i4.p1
MSFDRHHQMDELLMLIFEKKTLDKKPKSNSNLNRLTKEHDRLTDRHACCQLLSVVCRLPTWTDLSRAGANRESAPINAQLTNHSIALLTDERTECLLHSQAI